MIFNESSSLNVGINTINGPLQDLLWQDVNAKDLIAKFDKLTVAKRINYGRKADLEKLLKEHSALLSQLRKSNTR